MAMVIRIITVRCDCQGINEKGSSDKESNPVLYSLKPSMHVKVNRIEIDCQHWVTNKQLSAASDNSLG